VFGLVWLCDVVVENMIAENILSKKLFKYILYKTIKNDLKIKYVYIL